MNISRGTLALCIGYIAREEGKNTSHPPKFPSIQTENIRKMGQDPTQYLAIVKQQISTYWYVLQYVEDHIWQSFNNYIPFYCWYERDKQDILHSSM